MRVRPPVRLPISLLAAALALLASAGAAHAQGLLLPTDVRLGPLAIKNQRVRAEIKDGTAVTHVEQVFVNDSPRPLEAHYVFPLPRGAALSEFYLWINGKKTRAEILEKEKATSIYEGIVRRLADPGLLEYVDTDVFRARVFPVPAQGEQRIELAFSQVLDFSNGLYRYRYPLGAGARPSVPAAARQDFTFSATVDSKVPLRSIYSPTHPLQVARKGEHAAVVGLEQGPGADLSKDLDLFYAVSEKAVGLSMLSFREGDEPGFFLALISPRNEVQDEEVSGKRITFVIDTSGSMAGERIRIAREALRYCLRRLNPQDRFNVVRFSTDVEALFPAPMQADAQPVQKAVAFVDALEAMGGTAIDDALKRALKDGEAEGAGPHLVLFITDGQPTIGETSEDAIARGAVAANKSRSRVFAFGVGEDLNARLLDRLAAEGNGASDFLKDGKDFEERIAGFYDKVANPVLADLALELQSIDAYDLYPRTLPDLFKGSQLVVLGRYRTPGDLKVTLTGAVNGKRRKFEYGTTLPKEGNAADGFIPRLWAIRKVGYLLEEIRLRGEKQELRDEVVALGKRFGIVTPYTSYLVVEDEPVRPPMPRPGPIPEISIEDRRLAPPPAPAAEPSFAPRRSAEAKDDAFAAPQSSPAQVMNKAEGKGGIAISKKTREMKEKAQGPDASEPVRVAGGRTFLWRGGVWVDTGALDARGARLEVRYLSPAYFALLELRPDLKAALALGNRVTVVVAKGKTIVISPEAGEESAEKVKAFVK